MTHFNRECKNMNENLVKIGIRETSAVVESTIDPDTVHESGPAIGGDDLQLWRIVDRSKIGHQFACAISEARSVSFDSPGHLKLCIPIVNTPPSTTPKSLRERRKVIKFGSLG